jgi:trimeric autotransporter adhesin
MSLLGGILDVVGAAAAVVSGGTLGVLAGALLAVGAASQFGIVGGSVGKFMTSGAGQALMGAVALGSTAYSLFGNAAQGATAAGNVAANATTANAASQAASMGTDINAAGASSQVALTENGFTISNGATNDMSALADANPEASAASGLTPGAINYANNSAIASGQGTSVGAQIDPAQAAQAAQQATQSTQQAVQSGTGMVGGQQTSAAGSGNTGLTGGNSVNTGGAQQAVASQTPAPGNPGGPVPPGGGQDITAAQMNAAEGATAPASGLPNSQGGLLNSALGAAKSVATTPGALQGIGSVLSGAAGGASQQKQIEEMIQAQQWGNLQWQNQSQVNQLQAAAAAPITVPQGYLQRAQQVQGLMSGQNPQTGPVSGVQPLPVGAGQSVSPSPRAPSVAPGGLI